MCGGFVKVPTAETAVAPRRQRRAPPCPELIAAMNDARERRRNRRRERYTPAASIRLEPRRVGAARAVIADAIGVHYRTVEGWIENGQVLAERR